MPREESGCQDRSFIAGVFRGAMVGVNEKGVEAAAATAVVFGRQAAELNPKHVRVDRPFLWRFETA